MSALYLSPTRRRLARGLQELRRRLRRAPHRVTWFHQVDDPYCQLVAPLLEPLCERYDIELVPVLAGPPDDAAAPERERLRAYARKDAADIAPYYGQGFVDRREQPRPEVVRLAQRILAADLSAERFVALAAAVGEAMWSGDEETLAALAADYGAAEPATAERAVAAGDALRTRMGHYSSAMFHYAGEWYWGIDRLPHLEERLEGLAALRVGAPVERVVRRRSTLDSDREPRAPHRGSPRDEAALVLEFFASLRSPYTAIAFEPAYALARRYGVRLELRPVLPMVMRGLPVPRAKRLYIIADTKREAERQGIAFGRIADPVGEPVERAYSLFPYAREQGRAAEWLHSFARGAFAEGIDMRSDAGLRRAVERAGLSWDDARKHLGDDAWRPEVEANRRELLEMGLWGVPGFRLRGPGTSGGAGPPDFVTWGQDRLWLVEEKIRERLAAH